LHSAKRSESQVRPENSYVTNFHVFDENLAGSKLCKGEIGKKEEKLAVEIVHTGMASVFTNDPFLLH